MKQCGNRWAIVLAGGAGTRLRDLTTDAQGNARPKQFCSLRGGRTLLGDALARAERIVPRRRVVVVVAAEHERYWREELAGLPPENVVVQPRNRGTAPGLLLPLLSVLERDPEARVAVLPSDHFVRREELLAAALQHALAAVERNDVGVVLLGITPDAPEPDYGWIVPGAAGGFTRPVRCFLEKPSAAVAAELQQQGGVWNSFLFAAGGRELLELFELRQPELLAAFRGAFAAGTAGRPALLASLYAGLADADFSRRVLQGAESFLRLLEVPACGWTDLGTPARVAACVEWLEAGRSRAGAVRSEEAPLRAAWDLSQALRGRFAAALAGPNFA